MNPAVGRSLAPLNLPVKIDVVNAAPAVFKKSRRSAFEFSMSGLPSKSASYARQALLYPKDHTTSRSAGAGTLNRLDEEPLIQSSDLSTSFFREPACAAQASCHALKR